MNNIFIYILFYFSFIGYSFSTPKLSDLSGKEDLQLQSLQHSVWKIQSDDKPNFSYGTAFAIGSNRFVTNFHVLDIILKNKDSIKDVVVLKEWESLSHRKVPENHCCFCSL